MRATDGTRRGVSLRLLLALGTAATIAEAGAATKDSILFGGEWRAKYECFAQPNFGREHADPDGHVMLRTLLHATVAHGPWRATAELARLDVLGRREPPRSTDLNRGDLSRCNIEFGTALWKARLGRQTVVLDAARLVGLRDGFNAPQAFDGLWVWHGSGARRLDLLLISPVSVQPGVLDDHSDRRRWLAGLDAQIPLARGARLSRYLFLSHDPSLRLLLETSRDTRFTAGARVVAESGDLPWEVEFAVQLGRHGRQDVVAAFAHIETSFSPLESQGLRIAARLDVASGGANLATSRTFYPLYSSPAFFGETKIVAAANSINPAISLIWKSRAPVALATSAGYLARFSASDAVYSYTNSELFPAASFSGRAVAWQMSARVDWKISKRVDASVVSSRFLFLPSAAVEPLRSMTYSAVTLRFRF